MYFTTLLWDNIDFKEETLDVRSMTNNINGIIQNSHGDSTENNDTETSNEFLKRDIKTRIRTIHLSEEAEILRQKNLIIFIFTIK